MCLGIEKFSVFEQRNTVHKPIVTGSEVAHRSHITVLKLHMSLFSLETTCIS